MRRFLPALLLLFAPLAFAQNQTIVTGTITDPNGVPYYPATVSACLTPATLYPMVAGQQVNNNPGSNYCFGPVSTASNGSFLMSLWGNALITCSPACAATQWLFTVVIPGPIQPVGFGPQQFTATITISGSSQNISATLNAAGVSQLRPAGAATNATNLVGPGAITGTFSGTHTETGNVTFTGVINAANFDGFTYVDGITNTTIEQALAAGNCTSTIIAKSGFTETTSGDIFAGFHAGSCDGAMYLDPTTVITLNAQMIVPGGYILHGDYGTSFVQGNSFPVANTVNTNGCSRNSSGVVTCTLNTSQTYAIGSVLVFRGFTSLNGACDVLTSSGTALTCSETGGGTVASDGTTGTNLIALPLIVLGDPNTQIVDGTMLDSMTVNCNNKVNSIGVYGTNLNENSGLRRVRVGNCGERGIKIQSSFNGSPQNFTLYDNYVVMGIGNVSATSTIAVEIIGSQGAINNVRGLDQLTAVGFNISNKILAGLSISQVNDGVFTRIHCENATDCIGIGNDTTLGASVADTFSGVGGLASVTNLFHIYNVSGMRDLTLSSGSLNGGTNMVKDDLNNITNTDADMAYYILNANGKPFSSSANIPSQLPGLVDFAGGLTITSTPTTPGSTNTGWKACSYNASASSQWCWGLGSNSLDWLLNATTGSGWFSLFETALPANNATGTAPDGNAVISFGPNGQTVFKEVSAPTVPGSGFDSCYGDSTAHAVKCSYNNAAFSNVVLTPAAGTVRSSLHISDQGTACANGNIVLSAGWGTTAATTAAAGQGQTCQFTLTSSGTGQAANPTITDTLPTALPSASVVCTAQMVGGTGANTLINQTSLSATVPVFTFGGTPVAALTYLVVVRCGP